MEAFDRSLDTMLGFIVKAISKHAVMRTHDSKTLFAVQHIARVVHVLKTMSTLATYLNEMKETCQFYSRQRDSGLNDDILFSDTTSTKEKHDNMELWYWNVYLQDMWKSLAPNATPKKLHTCAINLQYRAVKPIAQCIQSHLSAYSNTCVVAAALDEHLEAFTGEPYNSTMERLLRERMKTDPEDAKEYDIRYETEGKDIIIHDANLLHLLFFAGPVENLETPAREAYCASLKTIDTKYGADISFLINKAARTAGHAGRRALLDKSLCIKTEDCILDENMFLYATRVLQSFRTFIEYENYL